MIHAGIYNSGVDFAGLLSEVSGFNGNEVRVRQMDVEVLPEDLYVREGGMKCTHAFYSE